MERDLMTDEEVEQEIERIRTSEAYKLARAYTKYKKRRRELLYTMRGSERLGLSLMERGITLENFKEILDKEI